MEGGKTRLPVQLTDEQKEKIRYLAALGWTDQELAGWLGMDLSDFVAEYSAHGSELHRLVTQGQLVGVIVQLLHGGLNAKAGFLADTGTVVEHA